MAYTPVNIRPPKEMAPISIKTFRGLNYSAYDNPKLYGYSPDCQNIILEDDYTPSKRPGYKKSFATSLGNGKIHGLHYYKSVSGTVKMILHHTTKLYTFNGTDAPTEIHTGMADAESTSININGKLYVFDGVNIWEYNGTTVVDISTVAYIPTVTLGRVPAGTISTANEPINLLTPYMIDSFSGTGAATVYQLSQTNLDVSAITASVDGGVTYNKVETTDFTVNRTTGAVTVLSAAAFPSGINNVKFKFAKTFTGNADRVKKCKRHSVFINRLFLTGNSDYPNLDFMSELYDTGACDPTYFPEDSFTQFGNNNNPIVGYMTQYNIQIIIKSDSDQDNTIYRRQQNPSGDIAPFTVDILNTKIGCIAPNSIQLINNNTVFLSGLGIKDLISTNVQDEKNIQHISDRIDKSNFNSEKGLLRESNLSASISIDFDNKYILGLNSNVYVWDYLKDAWYYWTNVPASCFMEVGGKLYFGSNSIGMVYQFKGEDDSGLYNDDGQSINSYWKTVMSAFGYNNITKIIPKINYSIKPGAMTSVTYGYITENDYIDNFQTDRMDLIDFGDIDFGSFTFETNREPKPIPVRARVRGNVYYQALLRNNVFDESFGFSNILIEWDLLNEVR